jgi:death-on-curing protein
VTRYLTLAEAVDLHRRLLDATGGAPGIRDLGALDSAIAQPKATFGGVDLYPSVAEKAAALCFSLVQNHPFVDGNKRVAHAEQERLMLALAAGQTDRAQLTDWLRHHLRPLA